MPDLPITTNDSDSRVMQFAKSFKVLSVFAFRSQRTFCIIAKKATVGTPMKAAGRGAKTSRSRCPQAKALAKAGGVKTVVGKFIKDSSHDRALARINKDIEANPTHVHDIAELLESGVF